MSARRNQKKEVARIDVDWLLGESMNKPVSDFSWFRPVFCILIGILAAVWSWPHASKAWLKWELQQQLADSAEKRTGDVLPILFALNELNPSRNNEMVPQPTKADSGNRSVVVKDEPTTIDPLDPPSLRQLETLPQTVESTPKESAAVPLRMQTFADQATTRMDSQLPTLNISIPRTSAKAMIVQTPPVFPEPQEPVVPITGKMSIDSQASTRGFDKRPLEELLPFLTSSQSRFVQQAANELLRRGMTQSQLETVIALAQGDAEQRLKVMETIVRDPNLNPIPLLVWMAESADRNVRRRAIVLLGSMTDPDALRKLRMLQSREPDNAIADHISQVLLASGTAPKSVR